MENVNHPSHYGGKRECIDVMRVMFGDEAVKGFCKCNSFKYRFRAGKKEGESLEKDIAKAEWYEGYLIEMEEEFYDGMKTFKKKKRISAKKVAALVLFGFGNLALGAFIQKKLNKEET